MLIVCVTITKFKTTPAVERRESQCWQRGNNRKATGEEADQLPKTHSCLAGSVRDSESFVKTLIHHFWGREMKITTALHHSLSTHRLLSCSAWRAPSLGEDRLCSQPLPIDAGGCHALCVYTCYYNIQLFCQPGPTAHAWHGTIMLTRCMVSAPKLDSYWLW